MDNLDDQSWQQMVDSGGIDTMPYGFQLNAHSGSKRKRTTSRRKLDLPPGCLIDVDTLASTHRKGYMALGGSVTSVAVPG